MSDHVLDCTVLTVISLHLVMLLCASYSLWVFGPHRLSTSYLGGLTHSRAIGTNSDFSFPVIEMLLFFLYLLGLSIVWLHGWAHFRNPHFIYLPGW